MTKIEQYVNDIISGLPLGADEQQELKEELTIHLLDHIDELMIKGYSKEEAISQAVRAFGKEAAINREMKKVLFPYYKFIRFAWSVVCVAVMLLLTSHTVTKMYFPRNDSPVSMEGFVFLLVISSVCLGMVEVMYDAISKEYKTKWLTNPWSFFLIPAISLEIWMYLDYILIADEGDLWIFHDTLFIPLYLVFYVVSRQVFTWLFVKKEFKSPNYIGSKEKID